MNRSSTPRRAIRSAWVMPLLWGALGLAYGVLDWAYLDRLSPSAPSALEFLDEFVDLVWPVLMGVGIGVGINLLQRQRRLNQHLSVENLQMERHVLMNVLISQLLHDIRNPIHNLAAVLEDDSGPASDAQRQVVRRNVEQLKRVVEQLSRWGAVYDAIDPLEPVMLSRWLPTFIGDQVSPRLRRLGVQYAQHIRPVTVRLHPLLLEQILVTLMTNACEALAGIEGPRRLTLSARPGSNGGGMAEILLENTGAFPAEVLSAQGREPVASRNGLGLGLLLVRKMLEQVGGAMTLENRDGLAVVRLQVAGGRT
jgi:signal transduction histidine kinase